MNKFIFLNRAMKLTRLSWRRVLEDPLVMRSRFIALILSLNRKLTKEQCIAAHLFWTECRRLSKRSGYLFLALYLKQARVCLQRYCAGDSIPSGLSPSVSLTRCGLPRIIPSFHRKRIARGDTMIIRLYMSFFSLSKLIPLARKVDARIFESIVSHSDLANVVKVVSEMKPFMHELITRYVPQVRTLPLYQGFKFVPTWKSVPSWPWYKALLRRTFDDTGKSLKRFASCPSIFSTLFLEQAVFASLLQFVRKDHMPQGLLWPPFVRYPFDARTNDNISSWSLDWFEQRLWPLFPTVEQLDVRPSWGRLCAACTGDGKRRLFAIGNYMNQRLLYPFHEWLMSVLKTIPMDGTFDQTAPLKRLKGTQGEISSVDLKSATDRWPLYLMFELTKSLFGHEFASAAVNAALAMNIFDITFVRAKSKTVSFIAGQPLGYYSSWPLFALSHHFVVWYAAETFYRGETFDRYAVLGDDVVIADPRVSAVYKSLLKRLGVGVSEGKSITSPSGACEFAKRFLLHGMSEDVSPVSMKKVADLRNPMNWYNHVTTCSPRLPLSAMLRIAGFGHKASARPIGSERHGRRAKRLIAMYMLFQMKELPAELSISVVLGRVLPPEVVGRMIFRLIEKMKPKDLIVPPPEVHPYPAMGDYLEYTLMQSWMKQYLTYLKWYALLIQGPCNLRDFLNAPVYENNWYTRRVDQEWQRFGIAFCIVDMARELMRNKIFCIARSESRDPNFVLIDYQRP